MDIPINFTQEVKERKGILDEVHGSGGNVWHVLIDHYHCGMLCVPYYGWAFDPYTENRILYAAGGVLWRVNYIVVC